MTEDTSNGNGKKKLKLGGLIGSVFAGVVAFLTIPGAYDDAHDWVFGNNDVQRVVVALDGSIADAAHGRDAFGKLIVELYHCRTPPDRAARTLQSLVVDNRKAVSEDLSAIGTPEDGEAQALIESFGSAMTWSERSDLAYIDWLRAWAADLQQKEVDPELHGSCIVPYHRFGWDVFEQKNASATEAKERFLQQYKKSAARFDVRQDWTATDF